MAAPNKKGVDYFSFDVNFLKDRKFRRIRLEFGAVGIMIYLSLLCMIYRDEGYYLDYSDEKRVDVVWEVMDDLKGKYQLKENTVTEAIDCLVDCGLFDAGCYERKILTSKRVQLHYYKVTAQRIKPIVNFDIWLLSQREMEDIASNSYILLSFINRMRNSVNCSDNEIIPSNNGTKESKGKKSKGNDSKGKKSKGNDSKENEALSRKKYGEYKRVLLSDEEYRKLQDEYGAEKLRRAIKRLDEYIETKGAKYKNCYLAMKKWVFQALDEEDGKAVGKKSTLANYAQPSLDYDDITAKLKRKTEVLMNGEAKTVGEIT